MNSRILTVLDTYPALSETFLYTALENIKAAGYEIIIRARKKRGALIAPQFSNVKYLPPESLPFFLKGIFVCWYVLRLLLTAPKKLIQTARNLRKPPLDFRQRALIAFRILPLLCENADAIYLPFGGLAVKYLELIQIHPRVFLSLRGSDINIEPVLSDAYADRLKQAIHAARRVHCVCEDIKRTAIAMSGADAQKFDVIYTALNSLFFDSTLKRDSSTGRVRIVTTGRLDWRKGLEHGLMAVRELLDRGVNCEWTIIGEGPYRLALEWAIRDLGLGERVYLRGGQGQREIRDFLSQSDIFFLPSISEGLNNSMLEAMAIGLPVVVSDVGGLSEAVQSGVNGFLAAPRDWRSMANALEKLSRDEALRGRMGEVARESVLARFTSERQQKEWQRFMEGFFADTTFEFRQFELEREWAAKIKTSLPGGERREAYLQAYTALNALMDQYKKYSVSLADKAKSQRERLLLLSPARSGRFLDIGCARGDLALEMQRAGWEVYGVDVEQGSVNEARRKLQSLGVEHPSSRITHGELQDVADGDFGLLFHSDVIEHIHPDEVPTFLQTCFQKTAPLGQMMIFTPNRLIGPSDISRNFLPPSSSAQGLHLKEYSLREMDRLLKDAGYPMIKGYLFHPSSRLAVDRAPRQNYHRFKMALEILFGWIPSSLRPRLLKRIMESMDYACVIAQRGPQ